jgi:hypothetical protein
MAMIAGGAFPENLTHDLESRGISVRLPKNYTEPTAPIWYEAGPAKRAHCVNSAP